MVIASSPPSVGRTNWGPALLNTLTTMRSAIEQAEAVGQATSGTEPYSRTTTDASLALGATSALTLTKPLAAKEICTLDLLALVTGSGAIPTLAITGAPCSLEGPTVSVVNTANTGGSTSWTVPATPADALAVLWHVHGTVGGGATAATVTATLKNGATGAILGLKAGSILSLRTVP